MTFLNWTFVKEKTVCVNHCENTLLTIHPTKVSYYPLIIAMDLVFLFCAYFCIWKTYERVLHLFVSVCLYIYMISVCVYIRGIFLCVAMYIKVYTYYLSLYI